MKRDIVLLTALAVAAGSLTAYGGEGASAQTSGQTAASGTTESAKASADGKTEITFWHYVSGDKERKYVVEAADKFSSSQDEVRVTAQYLPRAELMKQYAIGMASGELPDCGMMDNPDHNFYASMGAFENITELYNSQGGAAFLEGSLDSCYYEGKLYGLPWGSDCLGLLYNKKMLDEAGVEVPTTRSELGVANERLTTSIYKELATSAVDNEEGTPQYMPWLLSTDGSVTDLTGGGAKEPMSFLYGMIEKGYISRECINWTQADMEEQFASEQTTTMINRPWQFSGLTKDALDLEYGVAKASKVDDGSHASVLGGENVAICSDTNMGANQKFLSWITSKEKSQEIYKSIGRLSPRSDVDMQEIFTDGPLNSMFAGVIPTAQSREPSPDWPEIPTAIYTAQQEVFTRQKNTDTALTDAQAKIDAIGTK